MIAVDSNILAYLLIDGGRTTEARLLLERDPDWHSDAFSLVELTNILATTIRVGDLDVSRATIALVEAQAVISAGLHAVAHSEALTLANRFRVSAYDARYLGVALALGVPLVSEDRRLRTAAPDLTQSLADALAAVDDT
jgi:predicted nucleic acid-binding protein